MQTDGGRHTLRPAVTITTLPDFVPAADPGDTLALATGVNLPINSRVSVSATVGNGAYVGKDVDLYRLPLQAGDQLDWK